MRKEQIQGVGSIYGGEYESISVEGVGKLKGNAIAESVSIEGLFKSKGKIETKTLTIEGVHRAFRDIKAKEIQIEGVLKLRRASLLADKIDCEGIITCTDEVNTDELNLQGICSIAQIFGDKINIYFQPNAKEQLRIGKSFSSLVRSYFGRKVDFGRCIVDTVECTSLTATRTTFKTIRAQNVTLSDHCEVDVLYVDGDAKIDKTCIVKKIIKDGGNVEFEEESMMAHPTFIKILDLYKENKINADEAEKMLGAIKSEPTGENTSFNGLPWEDDRKLRVVAFLGHKLLNKSAPECANIEVTYTGEANNVEAYGSITCGDIRGHATAGSSVTCGDVGGNVTAGSSVNCKDVGGKIIAGGGVHIAK